METTTLIYLVRAVSSDGLSFNLRAFFSETKAYKYIAQLNIDKPTHTYTIEQIELIGD